MRTYDILQLCKFRKISLIEQHYRYNNVEATSDFIAATFDTVAKNDNGNSVEQVCRTISSFRQSRN